MSKLYERLVAYGNENISPFHMPGHKRKNEKYSFENPFAVDITEIDGFDNLHHPSGILKEAMVEASGFYGSEKSYFLINGSSCGILAAISACVSYGEKIIVARNSHKSVYQGMALRGLFPVYLCPDLIPGWRTNGPVSQKEVERAILAHPDTKAVLVTSPTYEGVCSDLRGICETAHKRGIPVIVDAAHGAHFSFWGLCESAVSCGADLVIESLHKTLPSLTQTAIIHKNSELVDERQLEWYLQVYQTSSPSYVLMASIDSCITYMAGEQGQRDMEVYLSSLGKFRENMRKLSHVKLMSGEESGGFFYDSSKLVIREEGRSGKELYDSLRLEYRVQPEMCTEDYVLLMTSVADGPEDFHRLFEVFVDIERNWKKGCGKPEGHSGAAAFSNPQVVFSPGEALDKEQVPCCLKECEGKVSGEFAYIYPPGIPLLVPGERITGEILEVLKRYEAGGLEVLGTENFAGGEISVIREEVADFGQNILSDGKERFR